MTSGFDGGSWWINSGQDIWAGINFGGVDEGPVYVMANPLNSGVSLNIDTYQKNRNPDGTVSYWVHVINVWGVGTPMSLQGGGGF